MDGMNDNEKFFYGVGVIVCVSLIAAIMIMGVFFTFALLSGKRLM